MFTKTDLAKYILTFDENGTFGLGHKKHFQVQLEKVASFKKS